MKAIVWVNSKLFYVCDSEKMIQERLALVADEPDVQILVPATLYYVTYNSKFSRPYGFLSKEELGKDDKIISGPYISAETAWDEARRLDRRT